jgi:NADPH:quinone reductase-like Zn-dependent oxidoreductase
MWEDEVEGDMGTEGIGTITHAEDASLIGRKCAFFSSPYLDENSGTWKSVNTRSLKDIILLPNDCKVRYGVLHFLTAITMIHEARDRKTKSFINTGANSTVGILVNLLNLHSKEGAKEFDIINVVRSKEAGEFLQAHLPKEKLIIVNAGVKSEFKAGLKTMRSMRPKVMFDCLGGKVSTACAYAVKEGGTVLLYGSLSGEQVFGLVADVFIFYRKKLGSMNSVLLREQLSQEERDRLDNVIRDNIGVLALLKLEERITEVDLSEAATSYEKAKTLKSGERMVLCAKSLKGKI